MTRYVAWILKNKTHSLRIQKKKIFEQKRALKQDNRTYICIHREWRIFHIHANSECVKPYAL